MGSKTQQIMDDLFYNTFLSCMYDITQPLALIFVEGLTILIPFQTWQKGLFNPSFLVIQKIET